MKKEASIYRKLDLDLEATHLVKLIKFSDNAFVKVVTPNGLVFESNTYMAMECANNGTLFDFLNNMHTRKIQFTESLVQFFFKKLI